jgi:hypothetical protein
MGSGEIRIGHCTRGSLRGVVSGAEWLVGQHAANVDESSVEIRTSLAAGVSAGTAY